MVRTAQISKEKWQSITTLRHEGQSIWKISRTLKVSSNAVAKTIKRYDETGSHEDRHRKERPRVTSAAENKLKLPASEIAAQINASQSSSNGHISTSTVQKRLRESGLHGRNASKKPLLKDTNNKKRLAWSNKHKQWTLDRVKSVLWSDESKC
jgi:transposase